MIIDWAMKFAIRKMINNVIGVSKKFKGSKWEKKLHHGKYVDHYKWSKSELNDYVKWKKEQIEQENLGKTTQR